jgi:multisubunit Na+/H+ antiporter MnhB subunit
MGIQDSEAAQLSWGILGNLATQLPVLAVMIGGIIFALSNQHKHPRASRLTTIALAVLVALNLVGTVLAFWLPLTVYRETNSGTALGITLAVIGFIQSLVAAGAWILILMAVFKDRTEPEVAR